MPESSCVCRFVGCGMLDIVGLSGCGMCDDRVSIHELATSKGLDNVKDERQAGF